MDVSRLRKLVVLTTLLVCASAAISAPMPTEAEYTNSLGMKFARIGPGSFQMGEANTLRHEITHHRGTQFTGDFDEHPVHKVTITRPFYAGVVEVTNYQFELFDPAHKALRGKEGLSKDDDEAVIFVNWYEAQAFCQWLSDKEGLPYRLPTEAEWEYACRAGTTGPYHTGELVPKEFHKNAGMVGGPVAVSLHVGKTTPNAWGLYDVHGNVEEWCSDWYGPYAEGAQRDPVGRADGDFRVLRSGSHATEVYYLRSANRLGTVPENKHWLIGFRVVIGEMPQTKPLPVPAPPLNQQNVVGRDRELVSKGPDPDKPYFKVRKYETIPTHSNGPLFAGHNHCPAIVECPNGDLLTMWYTGIGERERNMAIAASRLRYGEDQWELASPFWDPPDRNDTALSAWFDDEDTVYHFNSLSISSNWSRMAAIMRTSKDSGATWSKARLILPEHNGLHQVSEGVIRMQDGGIAITHDGAGTLWISKDEGLTWGNPGGTIEGNHPSVVQLSDGRLMGLGRGGDIDGHMPQSISSDGGKTFEYSASEFHPIGGGQRIAFMRLREGALFLASFGNLYGKSLMPTTITDSQGNTYQATEMFAALSLDDGKTWPYKRVVGQSPATAIECTDGGAIYMSDRSSEHRGYLSVCQGVDGMINLISSRQHYAFNMKWLMTPAPPPAPAVRVKHEVETFSGPDKFDLDNWFDYKSYTGGFDGRGKYRIRSIMPYGGISRAVGEGSFEALFVVDNMHFHPGMRWREMAFGFKDRLGRTFFLTVGRGQISLLAKDNEAKHEGSIYGGLVEKFTTTPTQLKMRFIYHEDKKQIRIFYGLEGDEPTKELPQSKKGIYLISPFGESNAAYFLMSEATADFDYFEIKPL